MTLEKTKENKRKYYQKNREKIIEYSKMIVEKDWSNYGI